MGLADEIVIPKTMSTQHPDNASPPPWSTSGVIEGEAELHEAYFAYHDLACNEVMWDSEGKDVDTNVVRKLLSKYSDYFKKKRLGEDIFLTYRIPNPLVEKAERKIVTQTLQTIPLSSDVASAFYEEGSVPVFEVILPFTTKGSELIWLDECYRKAIAGIENIGLDGGMKVKDWVGAFLPKKIRAIPLVEDAESLSSIDKIVTEYIRAVKAKHVRVFIARSDPALNYGVIAATLLAKVALSKLATVEAKTGARVHPIIGVGTMPFRGHLSPDSVDAFLSEYQGLDTVTAQSAFRYDYPLKSVDGAIERLNRKLPNGKPVQVGADEEKLLLGSIAKLIHSFQERVEALAPLINFVASYVPTRRARKLHIGLFGYSRSVKGVSMPRAIPFAAALYSLGFPPEFLGAEAIRSMSDPEWKAVKRGYVNMKLDYRTVGALVSWETVNMILDRHDKIAKLVGMDKEKLKAGLGQVMSDLSTVEETLKVHLGPSDNSTRKHENFVNTFLISMMERDRPGASEAFMQAAKLRRCLG